MNRALVKFSIHYAKPERFCMQNLNEVILRLFPLTILLANITDIIFNLILCLKYITQQSLQ